MRILLAAVCMLSAVLTVASGCSHLGLHAPHTEAVPIYSPLPNPLLVPPIDPEQLWQQVIDTIDDYFKIAREERIRTDGGVMTEGRIYTHPETGATFLEPWRDDSATKFERWHATLQTIRRYASVRVSPIPQGYAVEVAVYKELEDLAQPEYATAGAAILRHDETLVRNESVGLGSPPTLGWISLGREAFLEQRIIAEIHGRLAQLPAMIRLPPLSQADMLTPASPGLAP